MSKTTPRGSCKRLKLNLSRFQVEVLLVAASEEILANHSESDLRAWQAIARACQKALAYSAARAPQSDAKGPS